MRYIPPIAEPQDVKDADNEIVGVLTNLGLVDLVRDGEKVQSCLAFRFKDTDGTSYEFLTPAQPKAIEEMEATMRRLKKKARKGI